MASTLPVKAVPKYAWGLVVAGGLIHLLFSAVGMLPGNTIFFTGDPSHSSIYSPQAYSDLIIAGRVVGAFGIITGAFQIFVGYNAFRRGERWAWYAVAVVPIMFVFNSYFDYVGAGPGYVYNGGMFPVYVFLSYVPFALPSLLGLLLSIRSFFFKSQSPNPSHD